MDIISYQYIDQHAGLPLRFEAFRAIKEAITNIPSLFYINMLYQTTSCHSGKYFSGM
jgi:hypothetical protein